MTLHIIVCFVIVFVVLVQSSKGAQMGAAFGGSSQTVFGSRGAATFLTKLTTTTAIVFMITSFLLSFLEAKRVSVIDVPAQPKTSAPAGKANVPAGDIGVKDTQAKPPTEGKLPAQDTKPQSGNKETPKDK
ncbi:Preprotein translocase SecG subunit [Candidatus Magnetobacterium bavaricum]|uniref:Protein-export membrane protein SecG n=1 Tax=Candidatus Magnetobacterium bavaricum TaxID=29290 RepID=A0A0F3GNN0_9BACT|nr:Preprotein translocase SecG subunit [Candidatus Magnetobacterium bavaricum]